MVDTKCIGARIKQQRGRMAQERLANACGVSRSAVAKWESGESLPTIENLGAISRALACPVAYLIGETDNEYFAEAKITERTGLSAKSLFVLEAERLTNSRMIDALNTLLEFNNGDVIALFADFFYNQELVPMKHRNRVIPSGLNELYLLEAINELRHIREEYLPSKTKEEENG